LDTVRGSHAVLLIVADVRHLRGRRGALYAF
jgi:hypothetical protein